MRLPTSLRIWRLLPAYAINGVEVAIGIACIQLFANTIFGPHVAPLLVSGAVCASIADLPNTVARTWHRVGAAALLSAGAALVANLLRPYPLELGIAVALIAFAGMMTLAWGARAGAVSFAPVLSMIFSMAVPPVAHPLEVAGWLACGSFVYLAWAVMASALLQRRERTLMLAQALKSAAQLFRSRADLLGAGRGDGDDAAPLRAWISGEAVLADRLQAARDFLFAAEPTSRSLGNLRAEPSGSRPSDGRASSCRDIAILLRVIDLRDVLLASRLDGELLGDDATGRAILDRVATALRRIGDELDGVAEQVRDGTSALDERQPLADLDHWFTDIAIEPGDPRGRIFPSLISRLGQLDADLDRIHRLMQGHEEALPLTHQQLQLFVAPEGWPLGALRPHWRRDSLVLRHAIRMSLALATAYYLALLLPWGAHPYWLVLSVAVVLRGKLGETLSRRNARVLGTLLGCLVVVALSHLPSQGLLGAVFLVALGTAHAFATQVYWITSTAGSVMALLQSHWVNPAGGFAIAERVADTLLGVLLAWSFSYVLPSWERRSVRESVGRVLRDLNSYAAHSLGSAVHDPVEERLSRRRAYDSLAALAAALQRSRVEPKGVRLPAKLVATLLDHGERLMAHLSMVRLTLARLKNEPSDEQAAPAGIEAALADAAGAISARLDPKSAAAADVDAADPEDPDLLPERPAAHDVMPWLTRRLRLMVHEAGRIQQVAPTLLAA